MNYSPYIVDLILQATIEPLKHKATVKDGELRVTLYKTEASRGIWATLEAGIDDKDVVKAMRQDSLAAHNALEKELGEKRKDRRIEDERYSLRKQMGLDAAERDRLDNLKADEKQAAEQEVYETFARMETEKQKAITAPTVASNSSSGPKVSFKIENDSPTNVFQIAEEKKSKEALAVDETKGRDDIFDNAQVLEIDDDWEVIDEETVRASSQALMEPVHEIENDTDNMRYIPPPRSAGVSATNDGKIDISFTPRVFPTPMRESKIADEDDWIAKNRRHLKKHGVLGKGKKGSNDATEEDPSWLKAKGDDFYRGGDMRSALNAYSAAIDADDRMIACYSNRSACYFKLEMFVECRLDCQEGVKQLEEELRGSYESGTAAEIHSLTSMMVKLLLRRGAANTQLGQFAEAVADYERARNVITENNDTEYEAFGDGSPARTVSFKRLEIALPGITATSLADDVAKLANLTAADGLKKEADALLAEGLIEEAAGKYSAALALVPMHVGCLSNRSACKLAVRDINGCVDDCSLALSLLAMDVSGVGAGAGAETGGLNDTSLLRSILPPAGSDKRKSWVLKTTLRRGAAYAQLNLLDQAVDDFRLASGLDPKNEAIKSDLNKIMNFREGKRSGELPTGERKPRPDEPLKTEED